MNLLTALLCATLLVVIQPVTTKQSLNFLLVGDWGGQTSSPFTTKAQMEVADAMGTIGSTIGSQFVLSMGDHFYENGVTDVDDPRFKETFEDVFTSSSLHTNWYCVCGNHDHIGNCSAEIAYSKVSSRWVFPDFYYKQEFAIPGSTQMLKVVFIDTILLAGITNHILKTPPSGPKSVKMADDQWNWINATLAEYSKTPGWTLVMGHYPVWSVGKHGPTDVLVQRLKPILEMYGVAAYISGHDHNLQHINDTKVQYYVVGAGHLIEPSMKHEKDIPKGSLKYYYGPDSDSDDKGGFASMSVTEDTITTTYFNYKGNVHYQNVIYK